MRRINIYLRLVVMLALLGQVDMAFAAIGANSSSWSATEIKTNQTIDLATNVTINGVIDIKSGATLTINANGANRKISLGSGVSIAEMFIIRSGGKLIIKGTANHGIILDGGANFTFTEGTSVDSPHKLTAGTERNTRAIVNKGTLTLEYVTIQHFRTSGEGGAILINSTWNGTNKTYTKNGKTTIEYCTIQYCEGTSGAAIKGSGQSSSDEGTTKNNSNPEDCSVTIRNSTIQYCHSTDASTSGIVRSNGGFVGNLYLTNVKFEKNLSSSSGGGIYWNAHGRKTTTCVINSCIFEKNIAMAGGGAIMLESDFEFTGETTILRNNVAGTKGGGMIITGYGGNADTESSYDLDFDLSDKLMIIGNVANNGGGIAFNFGSGMSLPANSIINVNYNGATIEGNKAINHGGALHFNNETNPAKNYTININLNHGTLQSNDAQFGGGIYVKNEHVKYDSNVSSASGMLIDNNYASKNGGGLYMEGGSFTMPKGTITNNRAGVDRNGNENSTNGVGYGGGVYMHNGTVNIGQGTVTGNKCKLYGGGLYVYNESTASMKFSGGTLSGNEAYAGGGVCLSGPVSMTMTGSNVQENIATNGGGIYLVGGASLDYSSGLIKGNKAIIANGTDTGKTGTQVTYNTANGKAVSAVKGVGGGVFLDSGKNASKPTTLKFSFPTGSTALGFYDNQAYTAADDIFANGTNTSVDLPNVEDMDLTGFEGIPTTALYWFEDYVTKDAAYQSGTKVGSLSNGSENIRRYRYAIKEVKDTYNVSANTVTSYLCLALGYRFIYATIQKSGLEPNENAIFKVYNVDNGETFHSNVFLPGPTTTGATVEKKIALVEGTYKIVETDWSWTYSGQATDNSNVKYVQKRLVANQENVFSFTNNKKNDIVRTKYHEDVQTNKMGKVSGN